ncbi:MAG: pantetheine-phosphate adenylyltransferase [Cyclobacteriaceae bacterium]
MKRTAIFPGSFDPFTRGHEDIVLRGIRIFDEIIICMGHNATKSTRYFEVDMMLEKIEKTFVDYDNISVMVYNELTADLAKRLGANFLLRGLRNTTDFEYENSISQVNRHLYNDLETVFLITTPHLAPISSSIIRDVHRFGGDVSDLIPYKL